MAGPGGPSGMRRMSDWAIGAFLCPLGDDWIARYPPSRRQVSRSRGMAQSGCVTRQAITRASNRRDCHSATDGFFAVTSCRGCRRIAPPLLQLDGPLPKRMSHQQKTAPLERAELARPFTQAEASCRSSQVTFCGWHLSRPSTAPNETLRCRPHVPVDLRHATPATVDRSADVPKELK
jgi:hypothetical protein